MGGGGGGGGGTAPWDTLTKGCLGGGELGSPWTAGITPLF